MTPSPSPSLAGEAEREVWRGPDEGCGDFYADEIFVTKGGGIGMNWHGHVVVMSMAEWHTAAAHYRPLQKAQAAARIEKLEAKLTEAREALEKIAEGRGTFSLDQLTWANNTIEEMKAIASAALTKSSFSDDN